MFATTLVYKLVLFSPGLCRGEGGTNAHVKKSLGGIANIEGYEASRPWDEKTKGLKGGNGVGRKTACGVELH